MITDESEAIQEVRGRGGQQVLRIRQALGLDRAIVFTLFARGWSSMAGLITLPLIAHFLSGPEQGYYYTFGSLVALQIIFELGFSFVILQMASHERAHLTLAEDGMVSGPAAAHARLASVLQKSVRWYSIAAVLLLLTLAPVGFYFFNMHHAATAQVAWHGPWLLVVLAASCAFQIDPLFSFLEGCGYVPWVARTRWWQAVLGSLLAWTALLTRHGLYAPAMTIFGQVIVGVVMLSTRSRLLRGLLQHKADTHRIQWKSEVWPFQWRIAISWICGYFIFQLFVPVLFAARGPAAAGQMGMSLGIVNVMTALTISWVNTKAAPFGSMVARREWMQLDSVFFRAVLQSLGLSVLFCATAWAGVVLLNHAGVHLATRMLSPLPFGILLMTMVVNNIIFSEAIYLRSHKQEKMLGQSIFGAVAIGLSTWLLGTRFGAIGMVSGYFGISLIGLAMATWTFQHYRRLWHA